MRSRLAIPLLLAILTPIRASSDLSSEFHYTPTPELPSGLVERARHHYRAYRTISICTVALYASRNASAAYPFDEDEAVALEFTYHRPIPKTALIAQADKSLERLDAALYSKAVAPSLAKINSAYEDVDQGDRYTLAFEPGEGTRLFLNGALVTTIPGHEFALAYFGIWLGDHALSDRLRSALLK